MKPKIALLVAAARNAKTASAFPAFVHCANLNP